MARRTPRYTPKFKPDPAVIDAALAAMNADELRELMREITPWLDEPTHARIASVIIDRAARGSSGWAPTAPMEQAVAEIARFVEAARRAGHADPSDLDNYLREGSNAFLARNYGTASRIFRTLPLPLADAEIDLGQDEMVDEVLGVNIVGCAAQYAVAVYMTATPESRADAVLAALGIASFVDLAGATMPVSETDRSTMLSAMRKAAEKRIAGVTENKRRRHYEHAAGLALICVRIDPTSSSAWMGKIRTDRSVTAAPFLEYPGQHWERMIRIRGC